MTKKLIIGIGIAAAGIFLGRGTETLSFLALIGIFAIIGALEDKPTYSRQENEDENDKNDESDESEDEYTYEDFDKDLKQDKN